MSVDKRGFNWTVLAQDLLGSWGQDISQCCGYLRAILGLEKLLSRWFPHLADRWVLALTEVFNSSSPGPLHVAAWVSFSTGWLAPPEQTVQDTEWKPWPGPGSYTLSLLPYFASHIDKTQIHCGHRHYVRHAYKEVRIAAGHVAAGYHNVSS